MAAPADRPLILVVEDEPAQARLLSYNLERAGYRVAIAEDGETALLLAEEEQPDLVLLDWMLPEVSGIEVCRRLRRRAGAEDLPVIMLSARSEEADRVRGLDTGADDYIVKPYSVAELLARVKAALRRVRRGGGEGVLSHGALRLDETAHRAWLGETELRLGPTEYRLLREFLRRPGRVFDREQLLARVWGREADVETRTVDVHVGRLRKALRAASGDGRDPIRTVRGAGYALE